MEIPKSVADPELVLAASVSELLLAMTVSELLLAVVIVTSDCEAIMWQACSSEDSSRSRDR